MADNSKLGVAPPDLETDVGVMRQVLGDTEYTEIPGQPGMGNYVIFSDKDLEAFLKVAGGSVPRAIAAAYRNIGAQWASASVSIKTDDLSMTAKDSVGNWFALAALWDEQADREEKDKVNDFIALAHLVPKNGRRRKPEASPWPCGGAPW